MRIPAIRSVCVACAHVSGWVGECMRVCGCARACFICQLNCMRVKCTLKRVYVRTRIPPREDHTHTYTHK
jgi:hypothetical protein